MLIAVVELQQLPFLLLLKLHIRKRCVGAAAVVVVRHRVQDDAICCCVYFAADSSVSFPLSKHDLYMYMNVVAVLSHVQPRFARNPILIIHITHPQKLRACAEPRRAAARRGEAPLVCIIISRHIPTTAVCTPHLVPT